MRRYGLASLFVAAAALVASVIPASRPHDVAVLLAFPAAALGAAWFGGLGPGLLAAVLGLVASAVLVFPPLGSLAVESPADRSMIALQVTLGVLLSAWVGTLRFMRRVDAMCAEAVARSERKHRLLFDRNPQPMAIVDAKTMRILSANGAAVAKYGYSEEELSSMRTFDLNYPEDVPLSVASLEHMPPPGTDDIFRPAVWRHRTKCGAPIYVEMTASRVALDGCDCAVVLLIDVTDRVSAMLAMHEAEEKWRALLESSSDWFLVVDENDRVCFASRPLPGWAAAEIRDRPVAELVAPEDQAALRVALGAVRTTGRPATTEARLARGQGRPVTTVEGRCLPIRRREGVAMLLLVLVDVTRRREEEQRLRAAKEAADGANHAKDRFIAALSHELRTPLTPILAAASLAEVRHPEVSSLLGVIRRNVEIEARLIDDLLDTSRLVCGKLAFEPRLVDMHSVVHRVIAVCKPDADPKDLHVQVDLRARRPWVWVDHLRIEQALWNIIQNAVKFTPPHGTITVRSTDSAEGRLAVTVSNTGRGIPKEDLTRIFLPFEQVTDAAAGRGLGLGLAISKGIVDAAGGRLTAQSDGPESGASFTVELPAHVRGPASEGAAPPSPVAGRHLRILLVEDDPDTRETLCELLRASDCEVETADCVASAVRGYGDDRFDLVISDLGLPDGSGHELLAKLTACHPVPAIALSGYGMADDVKRSQASGFSAHLTKPISFEKLMGAIREVTA